MAIVRLTPQVVLEAGITPSKTACLLANTYLVRNSGRVILHVIKGAGNVAVTVVTPKTIGGAAVADLVVTVIANTDEFIGPFPRDVFNNGSNDITITLATDEVGLTIDALEI